MNSWILPVGLVFLVISGWARAAQRLPAIEGKLVRSSTWQEAFENGRVSKKKIFYLIPDLDSGSLAEVLTMDLQRVENYVLENGRVRFEILARAHNGFDFPIRTCVFDVKDAAEARSILGGLSENSSVVCKQSLGISPIRLEEFGIVDPTAANAKSTFSIFPLLTKP